MAKVGCILLKLGVLFVSVFIVLILFFLFSDTGEKDLGDGFTFFEERPSMIYYWRKGDTAIVFIPPEVYSYTNTCDYILAKQKPEQFDQIVYAKHYEYPYGRDTIYYWFVDKKGKKLVGPFLYSEMESYLKRNNLDKMLDVLY